MTLHLYKDAALTQPISEGDLSNPDEDSFNGSDGESKDRRLFLANEQTTLAVALGETDTILDLASPRFAETTVIAMGDEQMRLVSGGGSTQLTVERGYNQTAAVAHAAGTTVLSGFDYTDITIAPLDTADGDESTWFRLAQDQAGLDGATPGGSLHLDSKPHHLVQPFWRRITVPPNTPVQNKTDLKLQINAVENPILGS